MNELQIFKNEEFGQVRVLEKDGQPWFAGKDICTILEIKNNRDAVARLDDDEKDVVSADTLGGKQSLQVVNEYGLYSLILGSRKPEAKQFKRWITHEVVPTIRKHGAYMTPDTIEKTLTNPDFIIQLATQLKKEQESRKLVEQQLELAKPKVVFADAVSTSKTSILVGDLAKILKQNGHEMGAKRLFAWLRDNGYLIKRKGTDYNMPTQRSMELGLFEIKETSISHSDGHISISKTPKITGKGQVYFVNKFSEALEEMR